MQIKLKSLDKKTLNLYLEFLKELFKKTNTIFTIQRLPTKTRKLSLLKSPHVNKKAFEQFQLSVKRAIIKIKIGNTLRIVPILILNKPKQILLQLKKKF
jgi:small subunit ribosomal protein S10